MRAFTTPKATTLGIEQSHDRRESMNEKNNGILLNIYLTMICVGEFIGRSNLIDVQLLMMNHQSFQLTIVSKKTHSHLLTLLGWMHLVN